MTLINEQMERLLQESIKKTDEIYEVCKKIRRQMIMGQIMGAIRILLFLVPLILALIYLPPLIKGYFQQYQELLGGGNSSGIIEQLKELQGVR